MCATTKRVGKLNRCGADMYAAQTRRLPIVSSTEKNLQACHHEVLISCTLAVISCIAKRTWNLAGSLPNHLNCWNHGSSKWSNQTHCLNFHYNYKRVYHYHQSLWLLEFCMFLSKTLIGLISPAHASPTRREAWKGPPVGYQETVFFSSLNGFLFPSYVIESTQFLQTSAGLQPLSYRRKI